MIVGSAMSGIQWPPALAGGAGMIPSLEVPGAPQEGSAPVTVDCSPVDATARASGGNLAVPLKVLQQLGIEATWAVTRKEAVFTDGTRTLTMTVDNSKGMADGHEISLNPMPKLSGGRFIAPLRALAENLAFSVQWAPNTRSVNLYKITENPIDIETKRDRTETEKLEIDIQYPQISGDIPATVAATLNAVFADWAKAIRKRAEDAAAEPLPPERPPYTTTGIGVYRITYNQQGLLSTLLEEYTFTGGAHGMTYRTPHTFSLSTGEDYPLSALFRPGVDYITLLSDEIKRQLKARDLETSLLEPFQAIKPDQKYYIEDGNLVLFFDLYEYFPYAMGFVEFRIPMADLQNLLSPTFAAIEWRQACR